MCGSIRFRTVLMTCASVDRGGRYYYYCVLLLAILPSHRTNITYYVSLDDRHFSRNVYTRPPPLAMRHLLLINSSTCVRNDNYDLHPTLKCARLDLLGHCRPVVHVKSLCYMPREINKLVQCLCPRIIILVLIFNLMMIEDAWGMGKLRMAFRNNT